MSTMKDGGPAFPEGVNQVYPYIEQGDPIQVGMSLRDYFAGQTVAGLYANQEWLVNAYKATGKGPHECVADAAYEPADAMLAAREAQS